MAATDPDRRPDPQPFEGIEFRALFEGAPDACVIVDEAGRIVLVNEEAERMFGYGRQDLLGRSVEVLVPEVSREAHERYRVEYADDPEKRPMGIGRELFGRRADGSTVAIEIGLSPIETDGRLFTLAVVHDITLRRRLRAFGSGLLQGAEEERQRIARELHDDTAQSLAALVLRLQMARRSEDPETRERLLSELHEEIHRTSAGVRRILRGLRPPLLEESGLAAAVRAHAKSALAGTDLGVSFEMEDVEELLSHDAKLALYRIVQEALSNVLRHAGASGVVIGLAPDEGGSLIRVRVEDDGKGFDTGNLDPSGGRGLGLVGIMERASILGGQTRVESGSGRGTRIIVEVPAKG
ncbi:MAG: PAS domain S-box protein [Gemmatimonadota bacterium]|nr:PAS domain S-box protein [Gemmatimonadota bacterium]